MIIHLSTNIPHYNYAAQALEESGLLARYYTGWTLLADEQPPLLLPRSYRRKLEGRRLVGVSAAHLTRYYLPELLQKALPKLGICSHHLSTDMNNWLFDWRTSRRLRDARIFHFINTLGAISSTVVRRAGGYVVCDSRQEHPLTQETILAQEAARRGMAQPQRRRRLIERMLREFQTSDRIIVPSTYARRTFVENGLDEARISVLPYGVDRRLFSRHEKTPSQTFTILFIGTLGLRKGVLYLLEALRRLRNRALRLLCIGNVEPGMEPLLRPYRDLYTHLPSIPKIDLHQYYRAADAFVLPSLSDAYPLVMLEAISSGLPVITTRNTGTCDLIDERSGFIIPPSDADALADAIEHLTQSEQVRNEMSCFNQQLSYRTDWECYKRSLIECYRTDILPNVCA